MKWVSFLILYIYDRYEYLCSGTDGEGLSQLSHPEGPRDKAALQRARKDPNSLAIFAIKTAEISPTSAELIHASYNVAPRGVYPEVSCVLESVPQGPCVYCNEFNSEDTSSMPKVQKANLTQS